MGLSPLHKRLWYTDAMKQSSGAEGFTILETLIVLAITGFLLGAAALIIQNKQNQTQFSQAVGTMQTSLQKSINEVSTGYFPNTGSFTCGLVSPGNTSQPPVLSTGGSAQAGTNTDCILLGKVVQFAVGQGAFDPTSDTYNVYNVVGLRTTAAVGTPTLLDEHARLVARGQGDALTVPNDQFEIQKFPFGMTVSYVRQGAANLGAIGFISNINTIGGTDASQNVSVVTIPGTTVGETEPTGVDHINTNLKNGVYNPTGGIDICFNSGSTRQSAKMSLGGQGRDITITSVIFSNPDCT